MHHRDDYDDDDDDRFERRSYAPLPQSGWGIASFAVGLGAALLGLVMFAFAIKVGMQNAGGQPPHKETMLIGFAAFGAVGLAFVGAALGVVGLVLTQRRKTFAVLGTIINCAVLLGICGLMAIGIMAGG